MWLEAFCPTQVSLIVKVFLSAVTENENISKIPGDKKYKTNWQTMDQMIYENPLHIYNAIE